MEGRAAYRLVSGDFLIRSWAGDEFDFNVNVPQGERG